MAEILGLGMTHYPALIRDENMTRALKAELKAKRVPEAAKDPRSWPAAMREEWGDDEGDATGRKHRERCFAASRAIRAELDRFKPDAVVIFGDDQYENFVDDVVPPFCVFALDQIESQPLPGAWKNPWGEPRDKKFHHVGEPRIARWLINRLAEENLALPYAYRVRYERGLAHAFANTLLLLDVDRNGFPHKIVPFHVNCYGGDLIRSHGGTAAPDEIGDEPDPPAPSPAVCFDVGRAVARACAKSPWRIALIASSSWSHAFLTPKYHYLRPDVESDRERFAELESGRLERWRELSGKQMEAAGQHELLNWVVLAGAMHELGRKARVVDWIETYVMNSTKCFAVFDA